MDFDRWMDIVLMMLLSMLGLRVGLQYRSRRPNWVVEDTIIYNFVIWTPPVISASAFIFSSYCADIFRARLICNYHEILNSLFYIFPKISLRCDHFRQFLILDKHDREIIILFDFFMAVCFVIVFLLISILDRNPRNYERLKLNYSIMDPSMMKLSLRGIPVLFLAAFFMTFIYPIPFYSAEEWPISLLLDYGIGAFIQALMMTWGSYLMARAITMSRFRREQNRRVQ